MGQDGCERRIEVFVIIQKKKKKLGGGWGCRVGGGLGFQGRCEQSSEVFVILFFLGRGQGGCERRIEVLVKIPKKKMGGGGWGRVGGVRMDVKVFVRIQKKWGGGRVGGSVQVGGKGGCERRIEAFVKIKKKWGGGRVGCTLALIRIWTDIDIQSDFETCRRNTSV